MIGRVSQIATRLQFRHAEGPKMHSCPNRGFRHPTASLAFLLLGFLTTSAAQAVDLAGKRVEITVGFSAGGAPDTAARLAAQHLGRFFPGNPTFIVVDKPGAETIIQANYMAKLAPSDGTSIGYFSRATALQQVTNRPNIQFNLTSLKWFWGFAPQNLVAFIRRDHDIDSIDAAKAAKTPIVFGARSPGSTDFLGGKALEMLGVPLKFVLGYEGGQMNLGFERGELECLAFTGEALRQRDWLKPGGLAVPLVEFGSIRSETSIPFGPELRPLAGRESIYSLINKALGLPVGVFGGPPGMSDDMVEAYRQAFAQMAADSQFLADAERRHAEPGRQSGPELTQMFHEFLNASPDARKELAALVQ
jgi:tripartite-type tricarboxylate transporter receptor subunit TctC